MGIYCLLHLIKVHLVYLLVRQLRKVVDRITLTRSPRVQLPPAHVSCGDPNANRFLQLNYPTLEELVVEFLSLGLHAHKVYLAEGQQLSELVSVALDGEAALDWMLVPLLELREIVSFATHIVTQVALLELLVFEARGDDIDNAKVSPLDHLQIWCVLEIGQDETG